MKVFLHRISHHAEISYPLLDRNILTIGWCDFNSTDGAASFDEDFENSGYAKVPSQGLSDKMIEAFKDRLKND